MGEKTKDHEMIIECFDRERKICIKLRYSFFYCGYIYAENIFLNDVEKLELNLLFVFLKHWKFNKKSWFSYFLTGFHLWIKKPHSKSTIQTNLYAPIHIVHTTYFIIKLPQKLISIPSVLSRGIEINSIAMLLRLCSPPLLSS